MCLMALTLHASERFPLVMAGNRDEFLARRTLPLDLWRSTQGTAILGGRDGLGGGSWMGFSPTGRFAMLTNVRNPCAPTPAQPISRGRLVVDWLDSRLEASSWAEQIGATQFNGFNLIAGDWATQQCTHLSHPAFLESNRPVAGISSALNATKLIATDVSAGQVHGLSNATLDTPWPKTLKLQAALSAALPHNRQEDLTHALLAALADAQPAPDELLPDTGIPFVLEKALSSAFVSHPSERPEYGTRSSWVAVLEASGLLTVTEITHSHAGLPPTRREQHMHWPL